MALTYSTLRKPVNPQVVDPSTGKMREEWQLYFDGLTKRLNGAVGALGTDPAPTDAQYLVGAADGTLTAERVVTDGTSVTWDLTVAGQAKAKRAALTGDVTASADSNATTIANDAVTTAKVINDAITYAKMQNISAASRLLGRGSAAGAGDPQEITIGTGLSMSGTTLSSSGVTVVIQTFTASGTYTPTSGMKYCIIEVQASGGGGGGADGAGGQNNGCGSGGGGGGEYARGVFTAANIGASKTVTLNAAGTAGTNTGGNGGNGGSASVGALISANGGSGGTGTGSNSASGAPRAGGAGGTGGTGGSFRIAGQAGGYGWESTQESITPTHQAAGGDGGSSYLGFGPRGAVTTSAGGATAGVAGQNYGTGGSGANANSTTGVTGGAGAQGIVVITEFI